MTAKIIALCVSVSALAAVATAGDVEEARQPTLCNGGRVASIARAHPMILLLLMPRGVPVAHAHRVILCLLTRPLSMYPFFNPGCHIWMGE